MKRLLPTLDEHDILRVGGRLQAASQLTEDQRHPIILPKGHLASLIVRGCHDQAGHAPPETVVGLICENYWIPGLRSLARKIVYDCRVCRRLLTITSKPLMAPLPPERITPGDPFDETGVDMAGPVFIKSRNGKMMLKSYIAVFTCLKIRAVDLQLVPTLSTPDFLLALRLFIATRGCPKTMFSDNGKNFVGAERDLRKLFTG